MENISELLGDLTETLESQVRMQITNNWPAVPTAIIYAGERAYEAHKEIETTLHRVWRGRAGDICQMVIRDGRYHLPSADNNWQLLAPEEVQEQIDELFAKEQSFRRMNELLLILIQNTVEYTDVEQFKTNYLELDKLANQLGISACSTMKIVFLDESGRGRRLAAQVRAYLRASIRAGETASKATVILSNRLKNGVLLTGKRVHENYLLAADLILMANNSSIQKVDSFVPKYSRMFPISNPRFITASYTYDRRPDKAICEVLISAVLSWLEEKFNSSEFLSVDSISKKLEISGGSMKVLDHFFQQHIADRLPPQETLELLPRNSINSVMIRNLPFKEYDRITMGGFHCFYERAVLPRCSSDGLKRQFRAGFTEMIQKRFTFKEAAQSITEQTVEQVLNQLRWEKLSESQPTADYMVAKAKEDYYKIILPVCKEILLETGEISRAYIKKITEISDEFQHSYMLDVDNTVQRYYNELAVEKLNEGLGEQLLDAFNEANLTKTEILTALGQTVKMIFGSHPVFNMSMANELVMRMGGNVNMIQPTIRELTEDLDDNIRLQTAIVPEMIFRTMLADRKEEAFYNLLKTFFDKADSLDTGNSNGVEFLQLYAIDPYIL